MKYEKPEIQAATDALYQQLTAAGFEVLLDDRDKKTSPGVKFADMELMGIPHRLVINEKLLAEQQVEYKARTAEQAEALELADIIAQLKQRI